MSFFNVFLDSVSIDDVKNKICINLILGEAVRVLAEHKIELMSDEEIVLKCGKIRIKIFGSGLEIVTLAKGEVEITGNVCGACKVWTGQLELKLKV